MAGYVINPKDDSIPLLAFHTDTPNVSEKIKYSTDGKRVITLQLDCDELDAALWGLENYRKNELPLEENNESAPMELQTRTILRFKDKHHVIERALEEVIPNLAVGQAFVLDHTDIEQYHNGRVTNIKHVMFADGTFLTYVDISVSYPIDA